MFDVTTLLAIFIGGQFTLQVFCLIYGYLMYRRAMTLLAPRTQPEFFPVCPDIDAGLHHHNHDDDHNDDDDDDTPKTANYPEFTMKMNAAYTRYRLKRSGRVEFALLQTAVESLIDGLKADIVNKDYLDAVLDEIVEVYEPPAARNNRQFNKILCAIESPHNHSEWWNNVRELIADDDTAAALKLVSAFNDELQVAVPTTNTGCGNLIAEY